MSASLFTFFRRLGSTIALWTLILASVLSGKEAAYFCLLIGMSLLGLWEYFKMLDTQKIPNFKLTAMLTGGIFLAGSFFYYRHFTPGKSYDFELAMPVIFLMVLFIRQMFAKIRDQEPLQTMAYTLFGLMYIPWLFNFMTKIVYLPPSLPDGAPTGQYYVLYLIMVTKFSDMGAYTFGSIFGKHPFAPHISPKKTWEGFFGALITALLGSYWMYAMIPGRLPAFSFCDLTILGLVLGFAAVIGDLAESIVKRSTHIKDSSALLPGIGGTLDLIDSILFTGPLLFFYMRVVLKMG
ncbi:MAG: phosphatidate cytidylyltransferase [Chthoniobacterales bacterium]